MCGVQQRLLTSQCCLPDQDHDSVCGGDCIKCDDNQFNTKPAHFVYSFYIEIAELSSNTLSHVTVTASTYTRWHVVNVQKSVYFCTTVV